MVKLLNNFLDITLIIIKKIILIIILLIYLRIIFVRS